MMTQISEQNVLDALSKIVDPDLHKDIVTLGFIKDVRIDGGAVSFRIVLTTPACPVKEQMQTQAEQLVGALAGVQVAIASPPGFALEPVGDALLTDDPAEAVAGAHAVYTDVWVSMGDEETAQARRAALAPYRIDDALLDRAAPGAVALHCLPAHPGEEITEAVLYGSRQAIWDQAENRRHAQKALLELLLAG